MQNKYNFSIGILSWHSPRTLHNTLSSYAITGLLNLTDDIVILFQESTEVDKLLAQEFSIPHVIQSSTNIGIGKGLTELVKAAKYDNVLLLENDWVCVETDNQALRYQIEYGVKFLEEGKADMVKYRSRRNPGYPLYTLQFSGRELDCPEHLLECVHWCAYPNLMFPDYIRELTDPTDPVIFYGSDSKFCSHTNNPAMFRKDFYLKNISPFSGEGVDLEGKIFDWWREQGFTCAHGDGLFTHLRLDGPTR